MAHSASAQSAKQNHAWQILEGHDFIALQETHGTAGKCDAMTVPRDCTAFWSNGTNHQAGIGLVLKRRFLREFNPIDQEKDWCELVPGRMASLYLNGPNGSLNVIVVYLDSGNTTEAASCRSDALRKIAASIRPQNEALTLMTGDFNYVSCKMDRWSKGEGCWTGARDEGQQANFEELLMGPCGFHEMHQFQFTHDNASARSRLDRVYSNHHVVDQLDRQYACSALLWTRLSAHRPISFSRKKPSRASTLPRLPTTPLNHPEWPQRVSLEYQHLVTQEEGQDHPLRRLVLLKRAIKTVTIKMHREGCVEASEEKDDLLGWAMSYIRAVEELNLSRMAKCAKAYPALAKFVHPSDPNARTDPGMPALRDHALALAQSVVTDEMTELQRGTHEANSAAYRQKKDHILVKLRRLTPGQNSALTAVKMASGEITTDPAQMAAALQTHWAQVFASKPMDGALLTKWLDATLDPATSNAFIDQTTTSSMPGARTPTGRTSVRTQGKAQQGGTVNQTTLPSDPRLWAIRNVDIEDAIKASTNSAPGPDQIPYLAWRRLGALGIDTLYCAAQTLSEDQVERMLQNAYCDEGDAGRHDFNLGTLVCLPKKATGFDDRAGEYYAAESTRPLSIVNTDNRIIANAARLRWEPHYNTWISDMQQGFLGGRSIIKNLIDLDTEAMTISLKSDRGAIILFDFKAAFPSISQEYIHRVLQRTGMPEGCQRLVRSLYNDSKCLIACGGVFTQASSLRPASGKAVHSPRSCTQLLQTSC